MTDTSKTTGRPLSGEAAAIDRLLQLAKPAPDSTRERIMAAAERTPRIAVVTSAPPLAPAVPTMPQTARMTQRLLGPARSHRDRWGAAGILAASLLVGVVAGQTSYSQQTVRRFEQATGLTLASASHDLALTLAAHDLGEDD
jgi:hypothetical protein